MSYNWGYGAPPVWDPLSIASSRWDQSGLGTITQLNYNSSTEQKVIQERFAPSSHPRPPAACAQFPTRNFPPQFSAGAVYSSPGDFSTQAHGSPTPRSDSNPADVQPAAWAAHRVAKLRKYRCGHCGQVKESCSGYTNSRTRIRCECGGAQQDGQSRMHSK